MGDKRTKGKIAQLSVLIGVVIVTLSIINIATASINNVQNTSEPMIIIYPSLSLSPATATSNVGTSHILTATLINADGYPVYGQWIQFEVAGPNGPLYGEAITDEFGDATFDYVGTNPGTDTIVATIGYTTSNTVSKTWTLPIPPHLDLTPATATNDIGTPHKLTATLKSNGQPVAGEYITFTISAGPHIGTHGTSLTDKNGIATWSYTGNKTGKDTIVATGYDLTSVNVYKTWVKANLVLTPATATNDIGTSHTLTATLTSGTGSVIPRQNITFTVTAGPHKGVLGKTPTKSNGVATLSYTGTNIGTDTIVATGYGLTSNSVQKIWKQVALSTISLTPATAKNPVGTEHVVTATVDNGAPQSGVIVAFSIISGPNSPLSDSGVTDSKGQTTFTYTGSGGIGIDNIQASIVVNGAKILSNTAKKEWIPTGDILAYYRGLGQYPNIVETSDLLNAADDWRNNIIPPGFYVSITTPQLLTLADEWRNS